LLAQDSLNQSSRSLDQDGKTSSFYSISDNEETEKTVKATEVIERLRAHEPELRGKGIKSLTLFGSVARGETAPNDVDLAAEYDFSKTITLCTLSDIQYTLERIVGAPVDLSEKLLLKEFVRQTAERDFILVY
jgi:predicted nucleotidyltransferase